MPTSFLSAVIVVVALKLFVPAPNRVDVLTHRILMQLEAELAVRGGGSVALISATRAVVNSVAPCTNLCSSDDIAPKLAQFTELGEKMVCLAAMSASDTWDEGAASRTW
jgi:hypothetical protein